MKKSIRTKWTLTIIGIVTIVFLTVSLISVFYFQRKISNQTVSSENQKLEQLENQLSYVQREVETLVRQIVVDTEFVTYMMQDVEEDAFQKLVKSDHLRQVLARYNSLNPYYYSIVVYTEDEEMFSSNAFEEDFYSQAEWFQRVIQGKQGRGYSMPHLVSLQQISKQEQAVSYINPYHLIKNGRRKNGYMIVNFSLDKIMNLSDSMDPLLSGYALYNGDGDPLLLKGELTASYPVIFSEKEQAIRQLENGNILLCSDGLGSGWILAAEISRKELHDTVVPLMMLMLLLYLAALAALAIVLAFQIRSFTRPLEKLIQAAALCANGRFDTHVSICTGDEMETLGNAFNRMMDSINSYIKQLMQHEKEKKEMELERLLLQINPHFIYNTLNTIVYMAEIHGCTEIIQYTNAFISLLQDTLHSGEGGMVTLGFEVRNIEKYLVLMSYRYPKRFDVLYDIDKSVLDCEVPNVMLQPLVENAVFHGLACLKKPGHLEISVWRKESDVCIEIRDNGSGMSPETLKRVLEQDENDQSRMHKIGIANVRKRLENLYGTSYQLRIESRVSNGTKVYIRIPYRIAASSPSGEKNGVRGVSESVGI